MTVPECYHDDTMLAGRLDRFDEDRAQARTAAIPALLAALALLGILPRTT